MKEAQGKPEPTPRFQWVDRDARLIISSRVLRSFAQASVAVVLAPYLNLLGFSLQEIGLFITLGLAGGALFSLLVVLFGESVGRRRLLTGFTVLTGVTGLALVFTDQYALLAFMAFIGAFNVAGGGPAGPVQPVERAAITETVPAQRRTDLFSLYSFTTIYGRAAGTLAGGLPIVFQAAGASEIGSFKIMFGAYAALAIMAGGLLALLSPSVEAPARPNRWTNPFTLPSRRLIFIMSGLMSVDTFATRLVVQTLVALWLVDKFGLDVGSVALVFFATNLTSGPAIWLAARMSKRFGLLNTIVYSHVPAVVCVLAFPFAPDATSAIAIWITRAFFSLMDGAPRQSFMMAVVSSEERVAIGGVNQLGQSTFGLAAPSASTWLWSAVSSSAPFVASAVLKTFYLLGYYFAFKNEKPPEEEERR